MDKMLTVKQAALETGLSEYELRQGIKSGKYPCYRVGAKGGKYLISLEILSETIRNGHFEFQTNCSQQIGINKIRQVKG